MTVEKPAISGAGAARVQDRLWSGLQINPQYRRPAAETGPEGREAEPSFLPADPTAWPRVFPGL